MTEDEAKAKSFDLMADLFGMDEFQRIAVANLLEELGPLDFPNITPEQERKLIALGAIASERFEFP